MRPVDTMYKTEQMHLTRYDNNRLLQTICSLSSVPEVECRRETIASAALVSTQIIVETALKSPAKSL
jgi:hypothetical protein